MSGNASAAGWSGMLADQVDWHWTVQARPRLEGLTDEEYRWEPVAGAWNVRARGRRSGLGAVAVGTGAGVAGVRSLGEPELLAPCGEPWHASDPMAALVLHINRELIHHLAEVALLRDLWLRRSA